MTDIQTRVGAFQRRNAEMQALALKLHRSLLLQTHFPGAFDNGAVAVSVIGNLYTPANLLFEVRSKASKALIASRAALDVPGLLWIDTIRKALSHDRMPLSARQAYESLEKEAAAAERDPPKHPREAK